MDYVGILIPEKRIWPPRVHFGSENESLKWLNVDNDFVCV